MMSTTEDIRVDRKKSKHGKTKKYNKYRRYDKDRSGGSTSYNNAPIQAAGRKNECDESNLDIPGFYFDKEKKKYFKILPGQNHPHNSSFVTKESVQEKQVEDARQRDLKLLHSATGRKPAKENTASASKFGACSCLNNVKKKAVCGKNISELLSNMQRGIISPLQVRTRIRQVTVENLKPLSFCKVFDSPNSSFEKLEHMQNMIPSTVNPNNVICLWSVKEIVGQRLQTLSVQQIQRHKSELVVNVTGTMIPKGVSKITSICCAPINIQGNIEEYMLYTTMCLVGSNPSLVMLRKLNCTDTSDFRLTAILRFWCGHTIGAAVAVYRYFTLLLIDDIELSCLICGYVGSGEDHYWEIFGDRDGLETANLRFSEFNLSSKATWCCAWHCGMELFSVGTEKCGMLVDVETRSMWELNSQNSDVLAQEFIQGGHMLYSGTRRGVVLGHDLRSKSTHHTTRLGHKAAVCSLKSLSNGHHLLASDFNHKASQTLSSSNTQITKWDLRQRKVVTEYKGHRNQYSMIPLHVNEELDIIYSAGQDCYSRVWKLSSGDLMKEIPPPHPACITHIPTLHYSDCVAGRPGLLMGMLDQVHFYSM